MTKVAILGSGSAGDTLAKGFTTHGYEVKRGSREAKGDAVPFAEAARWADIVVLVVKGTAAEAVTTSIAPHVGGKLILDATNPIEEPNKPDRGVIRLFTAQNESLMERLQKLAPDAKFVKAFNSVGGPVMVNPKLDGTPTMFICGNDAGAKKTATEILAKFGYDTTDCGTVEAARPIESLCVLWCIPGFLQNDWVHAYRTLKPAT